MVNTDFNGVIDSYFPDQLKPRVTGASIRINKTSYIILPSEISTAGKLEAILGVMIGAKPSGPNSIFHGIDYQILVSAIEDLPVAVVKLIAPQEHEKEIYQRIQFALSALNIYKKTISDVL